MGECCQKLEFFLYKSLFEGESPLKDSRRSDSCFDVIKGLHQRSLFRVLEYIFIDFLQDETITLINAAQVSTYWLWILQDSLHIFQKAFQRRLERDPLSRIVYRRWKALSAHFPNIVEAEEKGYYGSLCQHLMEERQKLIINRRHGKQRTQKIDLSHLSIGATRVSRVLLSLSDDRLAVFVLGHGICEQTSILVLDRWTLASKYWLFQTGWPNLNYPNKVVWNDHFIVSVIGTRLSVWDFLDTTRPVLACNAKMRE